MNRSLSLFQKLTLIMGKTGKFALGLIALGVGLLFFAAAGIDWEATIHLHGELATGEGEVTDVFETNTTVNDEYVMGYEYVFHSPIGDLFWTSYGRGMYLDVGDAVKVEYDPDRPYVHRIVGMRNSRSGSSLMFIPILVGFVWLYINYRKGRTRMDILSHGEFAEGRFVSKEPTNVRINDRPQYAYCFAYQTKGGDEFQARHKSTGDLRLDQCTVIYHALQPDQSVVLEFLPSSVRQAVKTWK